MEDKGKNPAEFVCAEIWEIIFDKVQQQSQESNEDQREQTLNSSSDIHNCSQVCVAFRNILCPTRSTWLFREIFSFLYGYLDGKSVLTCRASCKQWKDAVDNFLENRHDCMTDSKGYQLPVPFYCNPVYNGDECEIRPSTTISQFMEDFCTHPDCPFPGRALRITDTELEENEECVKFWKVYVIQLLCRFGDQVHYLNLVFDEDLSAHTDTNWTQIFFDCLDLTPNLRRLRIEGMCLTDGGGEDYESLHGKEFTGRVPELPDLKYLEFARHNGSVTGWELNAPPLHLQLAILMPYSRQLRRLKISLVEMDVECGTQRYPMPNVEEITVKVLSSEQLASFISPECTYPELRRVTIEIEDGKHKLGDYLRILQRFKETLKVLRFIVYPCNHWQMVKASKSDLELLGTLDHLEDLYVEGFKFGNVEIANSLPRKLKYLQLDYKEVFCHRYCVDGRENWTDLLGPGISADLQDEQAIYASELWRRMPRLRWISVTYSIGPTRRYVYRRENWERWLEGQRKWHRGPWALRAFRVRTNMEICVRNFVGKMMRCCTSVVICCYFSCAFCRCSDNGNEHELM